MSEKEPYDNMYLPRVDSLALLIEDHWKKHAPKMYQEYVEAGDLHEGARELAEATWHLAEVLERKYDMSPLLAQSEAMRQRALQVPGHKYD